MNLDITGISWGVEKQNYNGTFAEIVDKNYLENLYNGSNYDEVEKDINNFKMFDETYQTLPISLFTHYRGYLSTILNKFILEAHQHGILIYLQRRVYRFGAVNDEVESDTKILTMFMLSAGFYVWLASVVLACIVFIAELIIIFIGRKNKPLTNLLDVKKIKQLKKKKVEKLQKSKEAWEA